ncbi:hypothetical protein [uncultured Psychroserpens sp.]|uniref:hypothetical protein n=1 Tax=uncultured Psychroserpens sp. TaxID=255436 RepID=UPI00261E0488|nr:hypothetical protein [uncultured Psychroserpens sp.]
MMKYKLVSTIFGFFFFVSLTAQTKNEKELRIDISNFPEHAQSILRTLPEKAKRVKFYKETDSIKESFESKFKYKHHWHSVEFDSDGNLEDIEVNIKKKQIPNPVLDAINMHLKNNSDKYDIIKIQEQYVYEAKISEAELLSAVLEKREKMASNYEIMIALKKDKIWNLREITFNSQGHFLSTRNIQQDSYEYIMY